MTVATTTGGDPAPGVQPVTALGRLAARCYDRRRTVLVLWILFLIGVTVLSQVAGTRFLNKFTSGNTPSQQAANILDARFPSMSGDTADVVFQTTAPVTEARTAPTSAKWCASYPIGPCPERDQPVLGTGGAPGRGQRHHRLRRGAVQHHDRPADEIHRRGGNHDRPGGRPPRFPVQLGGNPISSWRRPPPGPVRASASAPPCSSCCWRSARSSPWACRS